jgi:hypothetical protein
MLLGGKGKGLIKKIAIGGLYFLCLISKIGFKNEPLKRFQIDRLKV